MQFCPSSQFPRRDLPQCSGHMVHCYGAIYCWFIRHLIICFTPATPVNVPVLRVITRLSTWCKIHLCFGCTEFWTSLNVLENVEIANQMRIKRLKSRSGMSTSVAWDTCFKTKIVHLSLWPVNFPTFRRMHIIAMVSRKYLYITVRLV